MSSPTTTAIVSLPNNSETIHTLTHFPKTLRDHLLNSSKKKTMSALQFWAMFLYHQDHLPLLEFQEERGGNISLTGLMENGLSSQNNHTVMDTTQQEVSPQLLLLHAQVSLENFTHATSQFPSSMSWLKPKPSEFIYTTELSSTSELLHLKVLFQLLLEFKALKFYTHGNQFYLLDQKVTMDMEKTTTITTELMPHCYTTKKSKQATFQLSLLQQQK